MSIPTHQCWVIQIILKRPTPEPHWEGGQVCDPISVLTPAGVKSKMFLQIMHEPKLEWDQPLNTKLLWQWQKLSTCLLEVQTISIPPCCTQHADKEPISCILCGFCDASLGTYASVVNLLMLSEKWKSVKFLAANTPLRKQLFHIWNPCWRSFWLSWGRVFHRVWTNCNYCNHVASPTQRLHSSGYKVPTRTENLLCKIE